MEVRLIFRRPPSPVRQIVQRTVLRQTLQKTVIHLHRTVLQRQLRQTFVSVNNLRQAAFLLVVPPGGGREEPDPSRPTRTARRLLRVISQESARRELQPFYSAVVRRVLQEEQERRKSRPTQAISLIWTLFGRQEAFRTLTRFYMSAVERLGSRYYPALNGPNALFLAAGVLLHSRVYRRYLQSAWLQETLPVRYTPQRRTSAEELTVFPAARRVLPARELEEETAAETRRPVRPSPAQETPLRLSETEFRALARGVAGLLGREARLEALRRGRL